MRENPIFRRDRPVLEMIDPLSDFLRVVEADAVLSVGLNAEGYWSIQVPPVAALKCSFVQTGSCFLWVGPNRWELRAGDCFMVGPNQPFIVGNDPVRTPQSAEEVFVASDGKLQATLNTGGGPSFSCLSGRMNLPNGTNFLIDALPRVCIVRADDVVAQHLRWLILKLTKELEDGRPGYAAMASQVMLAIFIEILRIASSDTPGWLKALSDPRIGPLLACLHENPQRNWRLDDLCEVARLSRSQLSARFHAAVGLAPLDYLTKWRMTLAQRELTRPDSSISVVAERFGYNSYSAFAHAFKRVNGITPRQAQVWRNLPVAEELADG